MASLRGVQPFIRNLPLVATSSLHRAHQVRPLALLVNGVYAISSRSFSESRQNPENFSLFGRFKAFVGNNKITIGGSVLLFGIGSTIIINTGGTKKENTNEVKTDITQNGDKNVAIGHINEAHFSDSTKKPHEKKTV